MVWLKCTSISAQYAERPTSAAPSAAGRAVCERSPGGCLEFLLHKERLFTGSETRNVWLLWLEANSLFTESYVLILLMFSFHSLVRAIKEIVFLADGRNPCLMRPSGNLNFCHPTAERQWLPGRLFPAGTGGEANLSKRSLFRVLLCRWGCSLPFEGAAHTGSKPCA